MIRRGFVYRVARVYRDPKETRPVLVMTGDGRNLDPHGTVRPMGARVDDGLLDAVIAAVVSVINA